MPQPYGFAPMPPPKKNNTGPVVAIVAGVVAVLLVGVGAIWLLTGGSAEEGYPQSYEPTAPPFTGGDFQYVPGFDLCGAFSHAGIETLMPVKETSAVDELNSETDSGFYGCRVDYSNKETHGDGSVQGHLELGVAIYTDPQRAMDEHEWDQEIRQDSAPQSFDGLDIEAAIVIYEDFRGDSVYISAVSGGLWIHGLLTTNRPKSSMGKPEIPTDVLTGILTDIINESLTSMASA